ncbi:MULTISPECIES: hybrid sensor histidine kinase/response regulator [unclassified Synechocystis]|uniref:hybrid sensor histidine kinase/response regulator n=1 Tax=unclassified Synechocystis TaxID=2640012 RepID=UPI00040CBD2D|nr:MULTISPECIES: hybrid sensor histidine kinase/response regulator [unclassified Synechocystis]AIE73703.1 Two-component response regulator [Synechocystis sp. PCC 6714]MCT0252264.1 hybrid sensor histidine kinase/response regulator [Synechocystis sp. CS-94]
MAPASLLVVDDDPDNFDVIDALLTDRDYELNYADSGQQAIDSLDTFQPDLLLLDVMMPGLNGIEVCRVIRALPRWRTLPIIMVTALDSKLSLANCLQAGADDFISKPLNRLELQARIQAMLRLKYQYDALNGLLQQRESMVHMIVHDLRNPLTNLTLGIQILQRANCDSPSSGQKLDRLLHATQQIQHLVDDMLVVSKQEHGKIRLDYQEVELVALVQAVVEDYEAIASQKKLALTKDYREQPISATIDPPIFQRILSNLLSNAIKFSPTGATVQVGIKTDGKGQIIVCVADHGPGIEDDLKLKIFEPYEVGTIMPNVAQIGLGLAFCKMMSEAHGGAVTVEDNQPKGAVLCLTLPQYPPISTGWVPYDQWGRMPADARQEPYLNMAKVDRDQGALG